MSDYYLSIAEQRTGPHSLFYIIQGIREGRFHGAEQIWRKGMEGWKPLRELDDFTSYWPPSPEMLAQAEAARQKARTELDRPQPWLRFWARVIDLIWFSCALSMVLHLIAPDAVMYWAVQAARLHVPMEPFLLMLYIPVEAWLLSRYGTTPGKSLLRIQIRTLGGGLPTYSQAVRRTTHLVLKGLAFGLPLISLVVMLWWKMRLAVHPATPWDETSETRVEHGEPEGWRYVVVTGIVLGVALTIGLMMQQMWPQFEALRQGLSN